MARLQSCCNFLLNNEDKLAKAFIEDNSTYNFTFRVSFTSTPIPT